MTKANTQEATPRSHIKVFQCPDCGASITIRAAGQTVTAVCGSCGAVIDSENENLKVVQKVASRTKTTQLIPLGQRGKVRGVLWEVIGYIDRCDESQIYFWGEYLLFNPSHGFRWLTEFDGHWNYVIPLKTAPKLAITKRSAEHLGRHYDLFHRGHAVVYYVVGEFYWQIRVGDKVEVADYVAPPEMLSCEKDAKEITWSLADYLERDEIKKSFQLENVPTPQHIAPNQPSKHRHASVVGRMFAVFLGTLFLLQLYVLLSSQGKVIHNEHFSFDELTPPKDRVTQNFQVPRGSGNLEIVLSANVKNTWIEIEGELIRDSSGEMRAFEKGIEYYEGRDYDGHWREGSQSVHHLFSRVPDGTYRLSLEITGPGLPIATVQNLEAIETPANATLRKTLWPSGQVQALEPMVGNVVQGLAKYFYDTGQLYAEISFLNGLKQGPSRYYRADGKLYHEIYFARDKQHGETRTFDENGKVTEIRLFSSGQPVTVAGGKPLIVNLAIKRNVATWSNFLWSVFLISFYPVFLLWRSRQFEAERWQQSDFSPYYNFSEIANQMASDDSN